MTLEEQVRRAMQGIHDPCSVAAGTPIDLADMGLISSLVIDESGQVSIGVRLTSPTCVMMGFFTDEITRAVEQLDGVVSVTVSFDNGMNWDPQLMSPRVIADRNRRLSADLQLRSLPSSSR